MVRFQVDGHAVRRQYVHQGVRNLLSHPLLDGEAPREEPDQPRQLGDADNPLMRDVANVRVPVEGESVMLTERVELDWTLNDLAQVTV